MIAVQRSVVDLRDVRVAGQAMLLAALAWPLLPDGAGVPCPLRSVTGIPCPLCGLTTSVTATVSGDLPEALAANPAGILLVIVAVALVIARQWESVRLPVILIPVALAATWIFELFRFQVI